MKPDLLRGSVASAPRPTAVLVRTALLAVAVAGGASVLAAPHPDEPWRSLTTADGSSVGKRHETSAVELNGRIYVLGGRHRRSATVFDASSRTWRALPDLPQELHHFQPVAVGTSIYALGAMTCCFPSEPGVATIHVFDTLDERWTTAGTVPADRVRGGAGAVLHDGWIYLVGGNTLGHSGGAVPWLDRYDPVSGAWERLDDAPNARDHFQVALIGERIVAAGGRQSAMPSPQSNTVRATDVYDLTTGRWSTGEPIPTARGGSVSVGHDGEAIVLGGEIADSATALDAVEAYDVEGDRWRALSPLRQGRHGAGAVVIGETLHIVAGSLNRGGSPETDSHETLALDGGEPPDPDGDDDGLDDADETALHGTDPTDPDSDDDGLLDGREITLGTSPIDPDGDSDGLLDGAEIDVHDTDPADSDSDDDGLADGAEIDAHSTDPNDPDSDDDGLADGAEVDTHSTDPNDPDSDDDGLADGAEIDTHSTDPNDPDSDDDGLSDGAEVDAHSTDPNDPDSDDDGLSDGREIALGTSPVDSDGDVDGLSDGAEVDVHSTDPNDPDSDDDGTADGAEIPLGRDPARADAPVSNPPSEPPTDPVTPPVTGTDPGSETPTPAPAPAPVSGGNGGGGGGASTWTPLLFGLLALVRRRSFGARHANRS